VGPTLSFLGEKNYSRTFLLRQPNNFWSPSNDMAVLNGDQNSSVTIQWWLCRMVIEFFWSPPDTPPLFDGNQIFF
jgi:hypothetical protein